MVSELRKATVDEIDSKLRELQLMLVEGLNSIDEKTPLQQREQFIGRIRQESATLEGMLVSLESTKHAPTRNNISMMGAVLGALSETKTVAETVSVYCEQNAPYFSHSIARLISVIDNHYAILQRNRDQMLKYSDAIISRLKNGGASEKSLEKFTMAHESLKAGHAPKPVTPANEEIDKSLEAITPQDAEPQKSKVVFEEADRQRIWEMYSTVRKLGRDVAAISENLAKHELVHSSENAKRQTAELSEDQQKALFAIGPELKSIKHNLNTLSFRVMNIESTSERHDKNLQEIAGMLRSIDARVQGLERNLTAANESQGKKMDFLAEQIAELNANISGLRDDLGMLVSALGSLSEDEAAQHEALLETVSPEICKLGVDARNKRITRQILAGLPDDAVNLPEEKTEVVAYPAVDVHARDEHWSVTETPPSEACATTQKVSPKDDELKEFFGASDGKGVEASNSEDKNADLEKTAVAGVPQPPPVPPEYFEEAARQEKTAASPAGVFKAQEPFELIRFLSEMEAHGKSDSFPTESAAFEQLLNLSSTMIAMNKDSGYKLARRLAESIVEDIVEGRRVTKASHILDVAQRHSVPFVYIDKDKRAQQSIRSTLEMCNKAFRPHRKPMTFKYLKVACATAVAVSAAIAGGITAYEHINESGPLMQKVTEKIDSTRKKAMDAYHRLIANSDELSEDAIRKIEQKVCGGKPNCKVRIRTAKGQ
ncbi:MAG: hypothetical protein QXU54_02700 [Candidatus Micrarchaeia archaeon]